MARRVVTRGSTRKSTWFHITPAAFTQAAGGATLCYTLNAAALAMRPFTIVRTHLELGLRSDQEAAIETQVLGVGIAVVSDQAVGVGVTAVPTPVTEAGSSLWFLHQFMFGDAVNLTDRAIGGQYRSVDSKAMRKVDLGQDIAIVIERNSGDGLIATIGGRLLIKNN